MFLHLLNSVSTIASLIELFTTLPNILESTLAITQTSHSREKMVCVPCFIIPVLLFLWHKFIQPYVLRFWNPWAVKDADGNVTTEFPFKCEGGVCAFSGKQKKALETEESDKNTEPADTRLKSE